MIVAKGLKKVKIFKVRDLELEEFLRNKTCKYDGNITLYTSNKNKNRNKIQKEING